MNFELLVYLFHNDSCNFGEICDFLVKKMHVKEKYEINNNNNKPLVQYLFPSSPSRLAAVKTKPENHNHNLHHRLPRISSN